MNPRLRFIGPLVVALVGVIMLVWSWGTWPDPVIDFGREIYVPWQLSEGQVLYRDIVSYFNGPLSPYVHATLFKIFGPSLRVLVIFNLLVIGLLVTMMYRLIAQVAGHLAATAGGVVFFVLFAFAQFLVTGNFNFVCPYSYELTHGIALTVVGIVLLDLWIRRDRSLWLAAAGGMLGLIALTKAEVFLAAGVGLGMALFGTLIARRAGAREWIRCGAIFVAAGCAAPLLAFGLLMLELPAGEALRGMLGAWRWVAQSELTDLPYFLQLAGTDDIPASLRITLVWTGYYALLIAPAVLVGYLARQRRTMFIASLIIFVAIVALGLWVWPRVNWNDFVRPAPLVLGVMWIVLVVLLFRRRQLQLVVPLVLVSWSLALLAKMPLNAHIYHYGFALAMPATVLLVVVLLGWIPRLIERDSSRGWPVRAVAAGAILVALWAHLHPLHMFYSSKAVAVARGGDRFRADQRGIAINQLLEHLSHAAHPRDTLVMLPEGLLVNYLARLPNPTGQLNFTPPALIMYGEDAMLEAFQNHPPDWIGITSIDTAEYGPRFFGLDYALRLNAWLESNYDEAEVFRSRWSNKIFEIRLLRRSDQSR